MAEPHDELNARTAPGRPNEPGESSTGEDPGEIRPEHLRHEAVAALRQETVERVDRLIGEVTLRASHAGTAAAEVAQQVTREALTRVDAMRTRVTGGTPTETGERTRREARTAVERIRRWAREDPARFAGALALVLAAVVVIARAPRNPTEERIRALQRRARGEAQVR